MNNRPNQDQSLRADIYACFLAGDTNVEAAEETGAKLYYVNERYQNFIVSRGLVPENRLGQIKEIEYQLFWAIENSGSPMLIDRLQKSYSKFLL